MRSDLPSGTVTFLFTDVEGSTRLLDEVGAQRYADVLAEHCRVIRETCSRQGGVEVDTQGDAFFFAFPTAPGALAAASAFSEAFASGPVQVRVGIHTGTPLLTAEGYVGHDVHRAARIAAAGHGRQVLVSASTVPLVEIELTDLGEHRLKDLSAPERIYQLGVADFPPLKSLYRTNLPVPATPFLGRDWELAEVAELLRKSRMLTLTGPGGTGKTRLALQAVAAAAGAFPDGVFWVPLAALRDPEFVLATASQAIGARDGLGDHILDKRLLVLFDNFEHLITAAPELSGLLAACPNLKVVVTSREPLHLTAEQEYAVPPFVHKEGVGFFLAKARTVDPNFAPDENVSKICRRLDDLPLALELAAARVKALTSAQILERLEYRLPLLTGGARDLPERQRTLGATIEWSHELLAENEQRLFARLAVFRSGCTLDAGQKVCDADLDTLQSLVDKSLVRFSNGRYWMLETIREYATGRLEEEIDAEETRLRLVDYYVQLAEDLEPRLFQTTAMRSVGEDEDNLRTALSLAHDRDPEAMLRLAGALWRFWYLRVQIAEGRRWLEEALANTPDVPSSTRARAFRGLAALEARAGNDDAAVPPLEKALAVYRVLSDDDGVARCLNNLGAVAAHRLDFDEATRLYEEALAIGRRLAERGTGPGVAHPLMNLAEITLERGDLSAARRLAEDAMANAQHANDAAVIAQAGTVLAWIAVRDGQYDEAARLLRDALAIAHDLGVRYVGGTLLLVALIAASRGQEMEAARLWGAIAAQRARVGVRAWTDEERETRYFAPYIELERQLTKAGYDAHFTEGQAMSLEEMLELARRVVN
jgi:predicted ATPase